MEAGTKAKIDANRSLVELQSQQQRLTSEKTRLIKEQMTLSRIIGLPSDRPLVLSEPLPSSAPELPASDAAIKQGLDHRADLQAASLQVQAARQALIASKAEYLPSVSVSGSYGLQGINPNKGVNVFQAAATLTIPIWTSSRAKADVQQADAAVVSVRRSSRTRRALSKTTCGPHCSTFMSLPIRSGSPRPNSARCTLSRRCRSR